METIDHMEGEENEGREGRERETGGDQWSGIALNGDRKGLVGHLDGQQFVEGGRVEGLGQAEALRDRHTALRLHERCAAKGEGSSDKDEDEGED